MYDNSVDLSEALVLVLFGVPDVEMMLKQQ